MSLSELDSRLKIKRLTIIHSKCPRSVSYTHLDVYKRQALEAAREAMVADRRYLHQHPELSFQESNTGAYIAQQLKALGIETREGIAGTGVIGVVRGKESGLCICLRADIDALPIQESNEVPYRSRNAGVMHACGHDAHSAMVLGLSLIHI